MGPGRGGPENLLHTAEARRGAAVFIIGLELRPRDCGHWCKPVFGLGGLQFFGVAHCSSASPVCSVWTGPIAILVGLTLALSSTAFVLPTLAERRELHSRYGRETFAILLFQDLMVIPLLALLPLLWRDPGRGGFAGGRDWWCWAW